MAVTDPRCWVYPITFTRWVDGDTAKVIMDVGVRMRWEGSARVAGINCPEIRDPGGYEALKYAEQLVPVGTTRPCRSVAMDSFGRPLLAIDLGTTTGFDGFAVAMLEAGMAVVYHRDLEDHGYETARPSS
jgi:endonuclease YncB( thermonuclease family)